jgi:peptidoglycan/LPS O-acetylase OafA/YrhL
MMPCNEDAGGSSSLSVRLLTTAPMRFGVAIARSVSRALRVVGRWGLVADHGHGRSAEGVARPRIGQRLAGLLSPPPPSSGTRFPGIEGLRAVAASLVLISHAWIYGAPGMRASDLGPLNRYVLPNLPLGVSLFFTLSGFLLYRPFAASIVRGESRPSLLKYLRNRALRILPAYWVILLVIGLVLQAALLRVASYTVTVGSLATKPVILAQNAFLVQNYRPSTFLTGIGQAWSLAIEAVFYLALPLLVLMGSAFAGRASTRSGRRLAALVPAAAVFLIGLSGRAAAKWLVPGPPESWSGSWHSVIDRSFWAQADLFMFGMIVAVLWAEYEDGRLRFDAAQRKIVAVGAVLAGLLAMIVTDGDPGTVAYFRYYAYEMLTAAAFALLLALVVLPASDRPGRGLLVRLLETPILVRLGVISYSVFLWHEPLIRWLSYHGLTFGGRAGFVANLVLLSIVTGSLSTITYRYVELPALRRKSGSSLKSSTSAEGATLSGQAVPTGQAQAAP